VQRQNQVLAIACGPVHPRNSIIWKVIHGLLPEIDQGAAHRRYRENEQQRTDELGLKIPQAAVSADTSLAHTLTAICFADLKHLTCHHRRAGPLMRIQDLPLARQR
jgi:hypothetical protein